MIREVTLAPRQTVPPRPPVTFNQFRGEWTFVGQNLVSRSLTSGTSWNRAQGEEQATETSHAFSSGITNRFGISLKGITASTEFSVEYGFAVAERLSQSITNENGGSLSESCQSISCPNGNLWQWRMRGSGPNGENEFVSACSFVCIPSIFGSFQDIDPECPQGFCASTTCQCCSGRWASPDVSDDAQFLHVLHEGTCTNPEDATDH